MSDEGGGGGGLTTCRDGLLPTRMPAPRAVGRTMAGSSTATIAADDWAIVETMTTLTLYM